MSLAGWHPSELQWTRLLSGELSWLETWRLRRHVAACRTCRLLESEMAAERRDFDEAPQRQEEMARLSARARAITPSEDPIRRRGLSWVLAAGMVAAVVMVWSRTLAPDTELTAKGGDTFDVYVDRPSGAAPLGDRCAPGDRLMARYRTGRPYLLILRARRAWTPPSPPPTGRHGFDSRQLGTWRDANELGPGRRARQGVLRRLLLRCCAGRCRGRTGDGGVARSPRAGHRGRERPVLPKGAPPVMPSLAGMVLCSALSALPAFPEGPRIALLVGNDGGLRGDAPLRFTGEDVDRLGSVLTELGGFAPTDVHVLKNKTGPRSSTPSMDWPEDRRPPSSSSISAATPTLPRSIPPPRCFPSTSSCTGCTA